MRVFLRVLLLLAGDSASFGDVTGRHQVDDREILFLLSPSRVMLRRNAREEKRPCESGSVKDLDCSAEPFILIQDFVSAF